MEHPKSGSSKRQKRYNPEQTEFRGVSYRSVGKLIKNLRIEMQEIAERRNTKDV